jgi:hypothetical protein
LAPLDFDDTIVPPSLDHLTIDARVTNEALDHHEVVLEAIRGNQGESDEAPPEDDVVEYGLGVSIRAAADDATGPQAGRHLDGRKEPRRPALAADERKELIGQKPGRENAEEITVFKSCGLAIQDASTALTVFNAAKEKGIGTEVEL